MPYIRQKNNRWYYTVAYTDADGQHHAHEYAGGKTASEAKKAWRRAMADIEKGLSIEMSRPTKITVEEFLTDWLKECVEPLPKVNTVKTYKSAVNNHIVPELGSKPLCKVTPRLLQNFLNQRKKQYSRSTLVTICAVLKLSFRYAVDFCGYMQTSPAEHVRVPQYNEPPVEISIYTPEEMQKLFAKFPPGHQFYMAMMLSYHTGMRAGECLGLTWDNIDMDARQLHIRQTMVMDGNLPVLQQVLKTKSSRRDVPFGEKLFRILKEEHARQSASRLQYGNYYANKDGLVCCRADGKCLGTKDLRYFNQFVKTFGGKHDFHSLRHTHATMLLEAGEDLELVSKRLGHSSINTTAKVYSHVLDKRRRKVVELIDQIL